MIDLSRYFDLIGYRHQGKSDLAALQALHLCHTHAIPFENLSPLTGEPVRLDISSLLNKFTQQRGGYCYEHNLLFQHALETLGFKTRALLARVRMNVPAEVITPRSHMLLLVEAEGEMWIADTGFGRMTLTAPIRLLPKLVQATPHGAYRLMDDVGGYRLEADMAGKWEPLYVFDLTPCYLADYEMSNWYVSTHPSSHFVHDLVVVRNTRAGRHVIYNTRYTFYGLDSVPASMQLATVEDILHLLQGEFGIAASRIPGLQHQLERIIVQHPHSGQMVTNGPARHMADDASGIGAVHRM